MAGEHSGGDHEPALVEALSALGTGPEPAMPDLVAGAIARGTRMRRRGRVRVALSAAAVAAVVAIGGYGVFAPAPEPRHQVASAEAPIWYPPLTLVRSIVPPTSGVVEASPPGRSTRPGRHFRLTERNGLVSDLYVSVTRFPVGLPSLARGRPAPCRDASGRVLTGPWSDPLTRCLAVRADSGGTLLEYQVDKESSGVPQTTGTGAYALGFFYATPGGWLVQVSAGAPDSDIRNLRGGTPNRHLLSTLAIDPRLLGAAERAEGGTGSQSLSAGVTGPAL